MRASLLLALLIAAPVHAQLNIPGAGDQTIPILGGSTALDVEVSKAKLGFTYVRLDQDTSGVPCTAPRSEYGMLECRNARFAHARLRGRTERGARASIAAVDGKRDLFSGGRLNPGFEVGTSVRHVFGRTSRACRSGQRFRRDGTDFVLDRHGEHVAVYGRPGMTIHPRDPELPFNATTGQPQLDTVPDGTRFRWDWNTSAFVEDPAGPWLRTDDGPRHVAGDLVCDFAGQHALVATANGSWKQVKVVEFLADQPTVGVLRDDRATVSAGATLGYERWLTQSNKLGLFATGARNWNSAGPNKPQQVCTLKFTGTDTTGAVLTGHKCDDRIAAPLVDDYSIQPQLNWLIQLPRAVGPSWGFISGVSALAREAFKPTYNALAGLTLHPDGRPDKVSAAFLVTLEDFTDGNDKDLEFFADQLSVKMYLTIDLGLFD